MVDELYYSKQTLILFLSFSSLLITFTNVGCKQVIGHILTNSGFTAIYKLNRNLKLMCLLMPNPQFAGRSPHQRNR